MEDGIQHPLKGSCNCGFIEYEVLEPFSQQVACHCTQCQKHTQSAFSLGGVLSSDGFRLVKGQLKKWVKTADSGNRVKCYFCPECGNRIYHENFDMPGILRLKLGTLDNTDSIDPRIHVWTSMKQKWYRIPDNVQVWETQPDLKTLFEK